MRSVLLAAFVFLALAGTIPAAALDPTTNLDVSTATYLGGSGEDSASAVDVAPDGTVVFAGTLPGSNPGGVTPTELLGGGDGVVVRLDETGQSVLSVTRIGGTVNDLEVNDSGQMVICGNFGIAVLDATASTTAWNADPGGGQHCAIGASGTAAVLAGDSVFVYDSGGDQAGTWKVDHTANDIAVDDSSSLVFVTGFKQASSGGVDVQIPFIRAWSFGGELAWHNYNFSASEVLGEGLGGDTRGVRVAMGRDGLLYMTGTINGGVGASVFSRDPGDLTQGLGDRLEKRPDKYHDSFNMGRGSIGWYGRFNPADGALILGQAVLTRKTSDNKGNSITPMAIAANKDGVLFVAGSTSCCLPNREQLQIAGTNVGGYESSEAFFLVMSADFQQRIVWTPFAAPDTSAGGSPAVGVGVRDGLAAVALNLNPAEDKTRALITHNALQAQPDTLPDGYLAIWRFAGSAPPAPTVTVDAGDDQTVQAGETVTLQGTGTDVLTYTWTQTDGPTVTLSSPDAQETSFTAPAEGGTLTFELTGQGAGDTQATDTVNVTVQALSVDAGADQEAAFGEQVTLRGTGQGVTSYQWRQLPAATVELSDPNAQQTSFTAPMTSTTLTFELVGTGAGGLTATDTVDVVVQSLVADAGADQTVAPGALITLQGSASDAESYAWEQIDGPTVELTPTSAITATFIAPAEGGILTFAFTARGSDGTEDTDTITITVQAQADNRMVYLPWVRR